MKTSSIWLEDLTFTPSPSLKQNIETDVLVIGGGITGLNTCFQLINSGLNVTLVERNLIGHGVTSRTTGKLTFLQECIYTDLNKLYDFTTAQKYYESQMLAIKTAESIIKNYQIDCNFENVDSYIFTNNDIDVDKIKKEKRLLEKMCVKVKEVTELPNNFNVKYGLQVSNTAVFHPLKYLMALKEICLKNKINIYENTNIFKIDKKGKDFFCLTENNVIKAKKVVLALHYPFFLIPYLFPFKTHLEKSYIAAYPTNQNEKFSAITSNKDTVSLRYYQNKKQIHQLFLCNSHNLAYKNNISQNFTDLLKNINTKPAYMWSNKDIITCDKLPIIGELEENLLLATGYNTWGMTNGILSGLILKDIILRKQNSYAELFDPKCKLKKKMINFPINLTSNLKSFIESKIIKNKKWYKNNVKFTKDLAIYTDENGKEHIVYNKCPHLKCGLIFNPVEKTWDCPCHGSRFDIDGHVIEGPSVYDISYKD